MRPFQLDWVKWLHSRHNFQILGNVHFEGYDSPEPTKTLQQMQENFRHPPRLKMQRLKILSNFGRLNSYPNVPRDLYKVGTWFTQKEAF